jgi:hypothetical protein
LERIIDAWRGNVIRRNTDLKSEIHRAFGLRRAGLEGFLGPSVLPVLR